MFRSWKNTLRDLFTMQNNFFVLNKQFSFVYVISYEWFSLSAFDVDTLSYAMYGFTSTGHYKQLVVAIWKA